MSWDVYLRDDQGGLVFETNYTHNTNGMIAAALAHQGLEVPEPADHPINRAVGCPWWYKLNGMEGKEGQRYLDQIIAGLEAQPGLRSGNPKNGWGSYDRLLGLLKEMRDSVPDWPTVWTAMG